MLKKLSILFLVMAKVAYSEAQTITLSRHLDWNDTLQTVVMDDGRLHVVDGFFGCGYNLQTCKEAPYFYETVKIPADGNIKVSLKNLVTAPIEGQYSSKHAMEVPDDFLILVNNCFIHKKPYAAVQIAAMRRNNGIIERLISFDLEINVDPVLDSRSINEKIYKPHSVLSSGSWYKIGVSQDGIYKIDKSFLVSLGIDVSSVDPRTIKIYGNGGSMLPEANAGFRYDDLVENSIYVEGEADGQFNDDDFILFYGQAPNIWKYNTGFGGFLQYKNIYSDQSFYFITIGFSNGMRITSHANSPALPNKTITAFDDHASHESDLVSLLNSGKEWYGEQFKYVPSQSFSFSFPGLITSFPGKIMANLASRSTVNSSLFRLTVNGNFIGESNITSVSASGYEFARAGSIINAFTSTSGNIVANLQYTGGASDADGWLNYITVNVKRNLSFIGPQMHFRSVDSWGAGNISQFIISSAGSNLTVWDVTDPLHPYAQSGNISSGQFNFTLATDTLLQFIAFNGSSFLNPVKIGRIANQDLHGIGTTDFIIVTTPTFSGEAERLAEYHRGIGQSTRVLLVSDVYNEFSSGKQDPAAIRDLMKMLYDRAGTDTASMPKYLLLFGDGSYDYKDRVMNNANLVPTFNGNNSLDGAASYITDDFFGFLDDNEGGNVDSGAKLDIAVGRIPVDSLFEARDVVSKILHYKSPASFGNWRNNLTFVSDDDDPQNGGGFQPATDGIANSLRINYPVYNIDKIYLDAYKEVSTPGGARYPDVNTAINNKIFTGTFLMDFVGHGGPVGWTHERVAGLSDFESWANYDKLTLFVTATCDFTQYDNPAIGKSAGEVLLLNPGGGAIALVSTVRLVYSGGNKDLNDSFLGQLFKKVNGEFQTLGNCFRIGKNNINSDVNNRKFGLFGDPAMTLAYPEKQVLTSSFTSEAVDTMKALDKITVYGYVADENGNKMTGFNGIVFPTIFDKIVTYHTLVNDPGGANHIFPFLLQKNILYNGKASVISGDFHFTFIVPKDIQYNFGYGKISYYADNGSLDANGFKNDFYIGGTANHYMNDVVGPELKVYMNDEKFVFGGMTDANPAILLKLIDSSGINTTGTGLGHDITGVLDGNTQATFSMNEFYESDLDNFQKGSVHYPLYSLATGRHTLDVKAWDVFNNSAEGSTEFIVADNAQMALAHVLNYPNPFTTHTEFMFEHNLPGSWLDVKIEIYSVGGRLIKTLHEDLFPEGYRVNGIVWDGLDEYGDAIGKGVYVYRVFVRNEAGQSAQQFEKLVLLR